MTHTRTTAKACNPKSWAQCSLLTELVMNLSTLTHQHFSNTYRRCSNTHQHYANTYQHCAKRHLRCTRVTITLHCSRTSLILEQSEPMKLWQKQNNITVLFRIGSLISYRLSHCFLCSLQFSTVCVCVFLNST